jgi:hypothetical protein
MNRKDALSDVPLETVHFTADRSFLQLGETLLRKPAETFQHISEEVGKLSVKILKCDSFCSSLSGWSFLNPVY